MSITRISENDRTKYNTFVTEHNGSFLQSFEWGEWQKTQGRTVHRFLMTDDNHTIGAAQFIIQHTPLGNYAYCPYGPVVDSNASNIEQGLESLLNEIKKAAPDILCIRLEPTQQLLLNTFNPRKAEHIQPDHTLALNIGRNTDELLSSFHPKTRYNIKVAQKHDVEIKTYTEPEKEVIDLIMETSGRQGYRNHPRGYIEGLWKFFSENPGNVNITGYLAKINGQAAASGIMVDFGNTRMYLFGGSNYELRSFMAPYLMHWQAILDAREKNMNTYDFGAAETASGGSGGFMRFKLGFNPERLQFGGTFDIVSRPFWYTVYSISRKINRFVKHVHAQGNKP